MALYKSFIIIIVIIVADFYGTGFYKVMWEELIWKYGTHFFRISARLWVCELYFNCIYVLYVFLKVFYVCICLMHCIFFMCHAAIWHNKWKITVIIVIIYWVACNTKWRMLLLCPLQASDRWVLPAISQTNFTVLTACSDHRVLQQHFPAAVRISRHQVHTLLFHWHQQLRRHFVIIMLFAHKVFTGTMAEHIRLYSSYSCRRKTERTRRCTVYNENTKILE